MPERLDWEDAPDWPKGNSLLRRRLEIIERGLRLTGGGSVTADGRLTLSSHQTYVDADTTGGPVSLTLPPALSVDGYRIEGKVVDGVDGLTLVAAGSETIDGQPDVETFTRVTLVARNGMWVEL